MITKAEMILSDAPFVDTLVYDLKTLVLNCVIKNEEEALNNETAESLRDAELYIKCCNGTAKFSDFTYTRAILEYSGLSESAIISALADKNNIQEDLREVVKNNQQEYFMENYVEKNNYYRRLMGLPALDDPGIDVDEYWLPDGTTLSKPCKLHELPQDVLITMDNDGTLSQILDLYPKATYIKNMGAYSIDPYNARVANNFELLFVTEIDNVEVRSKFISTYSKVRSYVMRRVYSEAYKFQSDQYDNFIILYIVVATMIDMIDNISEFILNKEIFDSRCIRHMFESYGIPYYSDIPTKYQLKLLKNMYTLMKYKSTTQNMRDICALFGYDNIEIYKFYLLRHRLLDDDGNYIFATKEITDSATGQTTTVEDLNKEYELQFVKVPMEDQPDEYLKQIADHISYDVLTMSDYYWDGGEDHEAVKQSHLESNFGYKRTKYISIDTISDYAESSIGMPHFLNILYDDVKLEENLLMYIPYINKGHYFRLTDVFCYLFALTALYNGDTDNIYVPAYVRMDKDKEYYIETIEPKIEYDEYTETYSISNMDELSNNNKYITAFNFRPDTEFLNQYFLDNHVTKKELGIEDFQTPIETIGRYENLLKLYNTNRGIYDHVVEKMRKATNKREYDIYKTIYDHMMIDEFTLQYFVQDDGVLPKTYTEYMKYRDSILYLSLVEMGSITDIENRRKEIDTIVGNVLYAMDDYIDTDQYKFLFTYMPTVSSDFIKKYIVKMIDIFKSYKLQLYDVSNVYSFADKGDGNYIQILEYLSDIHLDTLYRDKLEILDTVHPEPSIEHKERVFIDESVLISLY